MGGKTGTAQKIPRDGVNYLVSFIGFAPVEDPQLVIYCVVDEPNAEEQYHSTFAQNIVREILEEVLPYMNIYRDEATTGIHSGWDIKGEEAGALAMTDIVNTELPVEDGLTDVPNTTDQLPGNEEGADAGTAPEGDGTLPPADTGGTSDAPPAEGGENPPADNTGGSPPADDTGESPPADGGGSSPPADNADMPPVVTDEPVEGNGQ